MALVLAGGLGAGALAGCGGGSGGAAAGGSAASGRPLLKITGAFVPEPVTTGMAAGFLLVGNTGGADTLTSVTSDLAARVTLHTTQGGTMRQRDSFPVPAHGTLSFARGGNHLMFEQLTHKPKVGDTVPLELHFRRSGTVDIQVPVKPATYNPGATDGTAASADPAVAVSTAGVAHRAAPATWAEPAGPSSAYPNIPSNAMSS